MNRINRTTRIVLACIGCMFGHHALANSANTSVVAGSASAVVTTPIRLVAVTPLQFGAIAQPQIGGTLTISPFGAISTTGDLGTATAIAQPTPPAAASFNLTGIAGMLFTATGANQVTISNGSAKMTVGQFTINGTFSGGQIGANGSANFNIGGTLTVAPGQAIGNYTGTFPITVAYY
jgi:hypothetical protein